jgi:hypothetical protein
MVRKCKNLKQSRYRANLYPGALSQLITGRMGASGFCTFSKPRILGGEGVKLKSFNLVCFGMIVVLELILFRISLWNVWVRSLLYTEKLSLSMKSRTFLSYSCWYIITREFPLLALVIMALCISNFSFTCCNFISWYCCIFRVRCVVFRCLYNFP